MDQPNSHDYYAARAAASRALAQRAANPAIAAIHQDMAARYEVILAETGPAAIEPEGDAAIA